jgi:thioredoxin-like negative regulator of GroEL
VEPTLEKLAREQGDRIKIVKVNVDENPVLSQRYGVGSIPTMLVVRNGQIVDRWSGALPSPPRSRLSKVRETRKFDSSALTLPSESQRRRIAILCYNSALSSSILLPNGFGEPQWCNDKIDLRT